jgi:NADPH:quinone reductase
MPEVYMPETSLPETPLRETELALVCERLSGDFSGVSLSQLERPSAGSLGPGQVLVRIQAAALNFPDVLMTQGLYQYKPDPPFVLGTEASGQVVACGSDVRAWGVGDPVTVHSRSGCIREWICVDQSELLPWPKGFTAGEASAWYVGGLTAYSSLVVRAKLEAGETLLVHGASGGMGLAAVQLGRALGARVIATASTQAKAELARAQGAHEVIVLGDTGFRDQVKALTQGRGVDVVFDPVGGPMFRESVRCMAWGGRLLVVGFASGEIPKLDMNWPLIKGFSIVGVRAGEQLRQRPETVASTHRALLQLAEQGVFKPHIGAEYPLQDSVQALQAMRERKALGKLVVRMQARS